MALFAFLKALFRKPDSVPDVADVLFFGLGNSTEAYVRTRHNIGFRVVESLSERLEDRTTGYVGNADFIAGTLFSTKKGLVIKPRTFMNRSGEAVKAYVDRLGVPLAQVLVIVDDYNLPLGKLRARREGSDGGHNGLKSIIDHVGEEFPRLRVGIGPLPANIAAVDFVLGKFTETDEKQLATVIPQAAEACMLFAREGIEAVMNVYNR
jgi:PTH1 family peptidyl-tRNA hydrolase